MTKRRTVALVAHDRTKPDLIEWAQRHASLLAQHNIVATGTTGRLLREACQELEIETLKSGPLGGDQQIGALIAEGRLDALIFFADVMTTQPHDVDVKALLRLAALYEVPIACNRATADLLIANPDFAEPLIRARYPQPEQVFADYLDRAVG